MEPEDDKQHNTNHSLMFTAIINLRVILKQAFPVYNKVAQQNVYSICPFLIENVIKGSQFCCAILSLHEYE